LRTSRLGKVKQTTRPFRLIFEGGRPILSGN
jgi:hypothetical protein